MLGQLTLETSQLHMEYYSKEIVHSRRKRSGPTSHLEAHRSYPFGGSKLYGYKYTHVGLLDQQKSQLFC